MRDKLFYLSNIISDLLRIIKQFTHYPMCGNDFLPGRKVMLADILAGQLDD